MGFVPKEKMSAEGTNRMRYVAGPSEEAAFSGSGLAPAEESEY